MKSMTGYGKSLLSNDDYELEIEIRSLNHRYLDMRVLLPRELNSFEPTIRDLIGKRIRRGKVDVRLAFRDKRLPNLTLDESKLKALWKTYQQARNVLGTEQQVPIEMVLKDPGIVIQQMPEIDQFNVFLEKTLSSAIDEHQTMAHKEGAAMQSAMMISLEKMRANLKTIEDAFPQYRIDLLNRFKTTIPDILEHALTNDDMTRIFTEVALYVDKSDIHEEITRLNDHFRKFQHLVEDVDNAGKTLNFILQEMHREINTIGDKFNQSNVLHEIIGIKEEIEKCREMVQNVE